MLTWHVVYTQPQKEDVAERHLLEQGFDVYIPRFKKLRKHARKVETVLAPLFPRYLFVGLDLEIDPWRSVNGTRGVSHLLMDDALNPSTIPQGIINALRSQETGEGNLFLKSLVPFVRGDRLRVLEGTFKDHIVVFQDLDDKGRVQLLLTMLGRDVSFTLPYEQLEIAS